MNKREFLKSAVVGVSGISLFSFTNLQQERPPALAPELVKDFVTAGHHDLQKVKDMLTQQPSLLNAVWDWGGGDFESALEGAGHMGNRDIAGYLVSKGARMNVFCAAMLGKIDIVKSILTAFPDLKTSKGPHGLMLLHHATKGGEPAKEVLDYLKSIGAN
jgi:hypothetical protein